MYILVSFSSSIIIHKNKTEFSLEKSDIFIVCYYDSGLQAFEMMGIAAVGNNLITYVFNDMHFPLSKSANIVTNFVGTVFLLSLLGGFLSDSYLGSFWTMLIFGFVELSVSTPFFFRQYYLLFCTV